MNRKINWTLNLESSVKFVLNYPHSFIVFIVFNTSFEARAKIGKYFMNTTRSICLLLCWQCFAWLLTKYLGCWQHSRLDLEWSSCWNVIRNSGLIWNEAWNWDKFFLKVTKVISWAWLKYLLPLKGNFLKVTTLFCWAWF